MSQRDGATADGFCDGGVLALGVAGDVDAAAEGDRPCVEALGEAGLAGADDAGEDEVWCGDEAPGVEDPGVVDEGAPGVEVLADEDTFAAEAAFGEEGVGACQGRRGVLVAWHAESSGSPQSGGTGFAGAGERHGRPLLSREFLGLALGFGAAGFAVGGEQFSRRGLAELAIVPPFSSR